MSSPKITTRLAELRQAIQAENISYSEIIELQSLKEFIPEDDTVLLEAAGVPENSQMRCNNCDWYGNEDDLIITKKEEEKCPKCKTIGCLMDIE